MSVTFAYYFFHILYFSNKFAYYFFEKNAYFVFRRVLGFSGYGLVLDMLEQSSAGCGGGDDRLMSSFRLEMCLIYLNKLISGGNLLTNRQCHTQ
jgi:hypothetical protein